MKEEEYPRPPKWVNKFVEWYCLNTYQDEVLGDLQELFERKVENEGIRAAQFWYYRNALLFMRLYNLKLIQNGIQFLTPGDMWKNYVKLSYRHMRKNAPYLTINILGLALALATGIFAYILVEFNTEFNEYFTETEQIYKVDLRRNAHQGDYKIWSDQSPINIGAKAAADISGVKDYVRYFNRSELISNGRDVFGEQVTFTDELFLEYFNYHLVEGSKSTFMKDPLAAYISQEMARKYFGDEPAVGKTIYINFPVVKKNEDKPENDSEQEDQKAQQADQLALKVAGVFGKVPNNNSFQISMLTSVQHFFNQKGIDENDPDIWAKPVTFLRVDELANIDLINQELNKLSTTYNSSNKGIWKITELFLTPFASIAEYNHHDFESDERGLSSYHMNNEPVVIFVIIAILIILVACFNFTNTGMALAQKRVREIGVRKALGGVKSQIIAQFLLENILTSAIALILSIYFADIFMQWIARLGPPFEFIIEDNYSLFAFLGAMLFIVSFLAGIYPALYVGSMDPTPILKGSYQLKGASTFTKVLLGIQFTISFIAVFGGITMYQNTLFQNNMDIGYKHDKLAFTMPSKNHIEAYANDIQQLPAVKEVIITPGHIRGWQNKTDVTYEGITFKTDILKLSPNYLSFIGATMLESAISLPTSEKALEENVIINEAMIKKLQLKDPLGKSVTIDSTQKFIAGVVKDLKVQGYDNDNHETDPMMIKLSAKKEGYIVVKTEPGKLLEVEDEMMSLWRKYEPYAAYRGDTEMGGLEDSRLMNRIFGELFLFLAILTVILSASGLFALMSLTIDRKTKEIGIRKVVGASFKQIVLIINKPYLWIVVVAWLLGTVAGYFISFNAFLQRFKYHIEPGPVPFIISLAIILLIAAMTMGGKVISAASANPTDTLRSD